MTLLHQRSTWLLTPALRPDRFSSAKRSGASAALVDIEDSVAPDMRSVARRNAESFFEGDDDVEAGPVLGIRINSVAKLDGLLDIASISNYRHKPSAILLPKADSPRDFDILSGALDSSTYCPELYALIETPRGVANARDIAQHPRVSGLGFGAADYTNIIGCSNSWGPLQYARSIIVSAARENGKVAIDSPFFDLASDSALATEAQMASDFGFHGKGAIHPDQVRAINDAFVSSLDEVEYARRVIAAQKTSAGVVRVDGKMVGAPLFETARAIVERFESNMSDKGVESDEGIEIGDHNE